MKRLNIFHKKKDRPTDNVTLTAKQFARLIIGINLGPNEYISVGRFLASENIKSCFKKLLDRRFRQIGIKYGLEIGNFGLIGNRFSLIHPFCITVNPKVEIGDDCVIFKGATIGSVRSGKRYGFPKIGDRVVIGSNAFVCGGISIGHDVLIAANSFVDFDVPPHSLVIGNPATIHKKENASKDYIQQAK